MGTISDDADRDALLRYLDLCSDVSDLVNRYLDLGVAVVAKTLEAKAAEAWACAHLPQRYKAPLPDQPRAPQVEREGSRDEPDTINPISGGGREL